MKTILSYGGIVRTAIKDNGKVAEFVNLSGFSPSEVIAMEMSLHPKKYQNVENMVLSSRCIGHDLRNAMVSTKLMERLKNVTVEYDGRGSADDLWMLVRRLPEHARVCLKLRADLEDDVYGRSLKNWPFDENGRNIEINQTMLDKIQRIEFGSNGALWTFVTDEDVISLIERMSNLESLSLAYIGSRRLQSSLTRIEVSGLRLSSEALRDGVTWYPGDCFRVDDLDLDLEEARDIDSEIKNNFVRVVVDKDDLTYEDIVNRLAAMRKALDKATPKYAVGICGNVEGEEVLENDDETKLTASVVIAAAKVWQDSRDSLVIIERASFAEIDPIVYNIVDASRCMRMTRFVVDQEIDQEIDPPISRKKARVHD